MLVIDVSLSMGATDIQPTRIAAAEDAATQFVRELPAGINLGVESFAATPIMLASPSTNRQPALAAIHELKLAAATNTGGALQAALAAIAAYTATIPGSDHGPPPARIVLESDGKQTTGPSEFPIAAQAGRQHIPINTISFGTPNGTVTIDGQPQPVPVDDTSLAQVAHMSGGEFFTAETNAAAHQVYDTLGHQLGYESARVDVSKPWLAAGTLAVILATALALGFTQRLPA
jgi:Ca-activated chloride channel family protein